MVIVNNATKNTGQGRPVQGLLWALGYKFTSEISSQTAILKTFPSVFKKKKKDFLIVLCMGLSYMFSTHGEGIIFPGNRVIDDFDLSVSAEN